MKHFAQKKALAMQPFPIPLQVWIPPRKTENFLTARVFMKDVSSVAECFIHKMQNQTPHILKDLNVKYLFDPQKWIIFHFDFQVFLMFWTAMYLVWSISHMLVSNK